MQRAIGHQPIPASEGVHFLMMEPRKLVRFVVTRGALAHLAGRALFSSELEDVFYSHRDLIEAAALRKYASSDLPTTRTTVDALDLPNARESASTSPGAVAVSDRAP